MKPGRQRKSEEIWYQATKQSNDKSSQADATPGRINQTRFLINRPELFYGQC